ncbi:putative lipid-binding protein AIR1B [Zingiber officinale]|uniref:Bifunctional inhibitor/plant lipid transfer protein/seed storage helical domain-containing protein n=1 Tax=Zingiber officinale TaxID=94328 RepID=A0A8J5FFG0_ZINOF|nr:putative lipid-binding protein AIR1B [Zingiber officinale]KAG6486210.1 hypothetical protein ZIOFF_054780 [Zingiber officinale]
MEKAARKLALLFFLSLLSSSTLLATTATAAAQFPSNHYKFPPKTAPANPFCPGAKAAACVAVLLSDVGGLVVGAPPSPLTECCAVVQGLAAAEAALCLCATVKESVLGITAKWTVALSVLLSSCKKEIPDGFKCV